MWIRKFPQCCTIKSRQKNTTYLHHVPRKFSPESIRAIAGNPNIDLQYIGIYSKSDIQHHIHTQQFQELLTRMDTRQRQPIDQNLCKLAEITGFSDIYT